MHLISNLIFIGIYPIFYWKGLSSLDLTHTHTHTHTRTQVTGYSFRRHLYPKRLTSSAYNTYTRTRTHTHTHTPKPWRRLQSQTTSSTQRVELTQVQPYYQQTGSYEEREREGGGGWWVERQRESREEENGRQAETCGPIPVNDSLCVCVKMERVN